MFDLKALIKECKNKMLISDTQDMRVFLGVTTVIIDQVWRGFQGIISVEENLMCSCIGKLWPLVFSSKQRYIHAVPLVEIHNSVKCQGQNLFFFLYKEKCLLSYSAFIMCLHNL